MRVFKLCFRLGLNLTVDLESLKGRSALEMELHVVGAGRDYKSQQAPLP